jgi:hypothetical protein
MLPKLIGIVGLAGSGKDTLADLLLKTRVEFCSYNRYAFADPLKEFTAEVFDFDISYCYDRDIKEQKLEFRCTHTDLYARFHAAFNNLLLKYAKATNQPLELVHADLSPKVELVEPFMFSIMLNVLKDHMPKMGKWESLWHKWITRDTVYIFNVSPRILLQLLGTEFFRDYVDQAFWSTIAPKEKAIFTDVRFYEEYDHVKENGGVIIRVTNQSQKTINESGHASEALANSFKADFEIVNNGVSLTNFMKEVDKMVVQMYGK